MISCTIKSVIVCEAALLHVMNKEKNVQGSDTRGDDSSNAAKFMNCIVQNKHALTHY